MVLTSAIRSRSLRLEVAKTYSATAVFCCAVVMVSTNACSGAKVIKETPKMVSGRVVKTSIVASWSLTLNVTAAPTDLPIQLRWLSFKASVQSMVSKPDNKRSA